MNSIRHTHIDDLRGLGIILIIFIHCLALYLSDPTTRMIWDLAHADVPIFVFCSGYLYFSLTREINPFAHIVRRLKRLLLPYYIYALCFYMFSWFANRSVFTVDHILGSVLVSGGIDISWLVLLFLQLTMVMLILEYWLLHKRQWFVSYAVLAVLSTIVLLFWQPAFSYKWYMWLLWSTVIIYSYFFVRKHQARWFFLFTTLAFGGVLLLLASLKTVLHQPLSFAANKYPPTLYYLLYGMLVLNVLYVLSLKGAFEKLRLTAFLQFCSRYSYALFFVHYFLLTVISTFGWQHYIHCSLLFLFVLALSSGAIQLYQTRRVWPRYSKPR